MAERGRGGGRTFPFALWAWAAKRTKVGEGSEPRGRQNYAYLPHTSLGNGIWRVFRGWPEGRRNLPPFFGLGHPERILQTHPRLDQAETGKEEITTRLASTIQPIGARACIAGTLRLWLGTTAAETRTGEGWPISNGWVPERRARQYRRRRFRGDSQRGGFRMTSPTLNAGSTAFDMSTAFHAPAVRGCEQPLSDFPAMVGVRLSTGGESRPDAPELQDLQLDTRGRDDTQSGVGHGEPGSVVPMPALQLDRGACFPATTWQRRNRGEQRTGAGFAGDQGSAVAYSDIRHAQSHQRGEHRSFPAVSAAAHPRPVRARRLRSPDLPMQPPG